MLRLRNLIDCCGWGGEWGGGRRSLETSAVGCPTCTGLAKGNDLLCF